MLVRRLTCTGYPFQLPGQQSQVTIFTLLLQGLAGFHFGNDQSNDTSKQLQPSPY
jgi:hypothetical protein